MRRSLTLAALASAALLAARAGAHEVGLSRGAYTVEGSAVRAEIIFARKELISLVATLDENGDGALTDAEVTAARDAIQGALVGRIKVKGDGIACPGTLDRAALTEQDGVAVHAVFRCASRPKQLGVELTFMDDLAFGHRHLARATAGTAMLDSVLSQRSPSFTLDVPADASPPPKAEPGPAEGSPLMRGARSLAMQWATPAFLLGLLASCSGRRAALIAAIAFTVAMVVGLALGASGLFLPSPDAIGVALALSLVYAGIDALSSPAGSTRYRVAIPFGLVHGLGCAHAARGAAALPFGIGVIAALIPLTAALIPAAIWVRGRPASGARGARIAGVLVAVAGVVGLVTGRV